MLRTELARAALLACIAAAIAPSAPAAPAATIQGQIERPLRSALERAIGDAKAPPPSRIEARRRARDAANDAVALLRSEGYYDAEVEADVSEADPPRALVSITPGPQFMVADPAIAWVGDPPSAKVVAAAVAALAPLAPGTPGRAADILPAEGRAVAVLQRLGYADARADARKVVVDHADRTVRPTFRIAPGDLVALGGVKVVTKGRTNPAWVVRLASWKRGDTYDPARLATLERRLVDTGVYESVTVALAPQDQKAAGLRPVVVTLSERPHRSLELSAAFSTTAGAGFDPQATNGASSLGAYSILQGSGVEAKWTRYSWLHRADTLTLTARLYDIQQGLDAQLSLPAWGRADQRLIVGLGGLNERTPAYDNTTAGVRIGVERHWTKTTFVSVGGRLDYVSLRDKEEVNPNEVPVGVTVNLFIPTILISGALDRSDSALDPIRGWRIDGRAEPTYVAGDRNLPYLKLQAQTSAYMPFDRAGATVLAGRLKLGSILGGSIPEVPADRRFYGGGGGSVRGFGYQAVGPRLSDNTPEGGLSVAEASIEIRRKITRQWGVVAFVDSGTVGSTTAPTFRDVSVGAGLGVRYDLGFGPFRLDVATPLNPRKGDAAVQVYISIGQAF